MELIEQLASVLERQLYYSNLHCSQVHAHDIITARHMVPELARLKSPALRSVLHRQFSKLKSYLVLHVMHAQRLTKFQQYPPQDIVECGILAHVARFLDRLVLLLDNRPGQFLSNDELIAKRKQLFTSGVGHTPFRIIVKVCSNWRKCTAATHSIIVLPAVARCTNVVNKNQGWQCLGFLIEVNRTSDV